jgi:hypothetical protein
MFSTPHTLAAGWHNQRHAQCHSRCVLRAGRAVGRVVLCSHAANVPQRTDKRNPKTSMVFSTVVLSAEKSGRMSPTPTVLRRAASVRAVTNVVATADREVA